MKPIEHLVPGTSGIDTITSFQVSSVHLRVWQMPCTESICLPSVSPPQLSTAPFYWSLSSLLLSCPTAWVLVPGLFQCTQIHKAWARAETHFNILIKPSYLHSPVDGGHSCEIKMIYLLCSLAVMAVFGWGKPEPEAFLFADWMGTEVRCGASFTKLPSKQG